LTGLLPSVAPLVTRRVRPVAVPRAARALATLARLDYEDAHVIQTGATTQDRTAEDWARTILEEAPAAVRGALRSGWFALGVQLGQAGPDRSVLGWEILSSTPDHALLGVRSRLGLRAELLLERRRRTILFATFLQLKNAAARGLWAGLAPVVHRPVVRAVLEHAAWRERRPLD
jgi:hypothetical protein